MGSGPGAEMSQGPQRRVKQTNLSSGKPSVWISPWMEPDKKVESGAPVGMVGDSRPRPLGKS